MDGAELFRLSTFSRWVEKSTVSPLKLARDGFFYDDAHQTIRCEAYNVRFDPLEISSSSVRDRHREQSPNCPVALARSASNTPHGVPHGFASPVGGDTASDYGSPIGPDDRSNDLQHTLSSARARPTFLQGNSGSNKDPSTSYSHSGSLTHLQGSSQSQVVYRRERLQNEESRLYSLSNWSVAPNTPPDLYRFASPNGGHTACDYGSPIGSDDRTNLQHTLSSALARATRRGVFQANSGSYSPSASLAYPQVSSQGQAVYRREQPDYEREQSEEQNADTFRNVPVGNESTNAVSAVMDREEISVLLPIIRNLGFNENDLRMLITERLSQGDGCLIPTQLLEALFLKH